MSLNSQQRLIFVYLRDKDDNRSCTPAGANLTNEYTCRTNKNDPCTVSVIPSQLCTFFRKRTDSSDLSFDSSEVSSDSSEVLFDSSEEIPKFFAGNFQIPPKRFWLPRKGVRCARGVFYICPGRFFFLPWPAEEG